MSALNVSFIHSRRRSAPSAVFEVAPSSPRTLAPMRRYVWAVLALLAAGCSARSTQAEGGRLPWTVPHVLRIGIASDPDRLNPYLSEMDVSYDIASLVYSYLIVADARGRLIGDLALAVPSRANGGISPDGRTYVYRLRRNVIWHDGAPFTSADVVASWRAVMDPRNDTFEREGYDEVTSIRTLGRYAIAIRLRRRYPPFVSRFFAPLQEGGKPILPAHVLRRERSFNAGPLSSAPVGTGPFRFVSWARGDRIVLERFDRYFKGRPKLQRIELTVVPNDRSLALALQTHRVDLIAAASPALLPEYRSAAGTVVSTAPWNSQGALFANSSKPALSDSRVRRSIADAVPYDEILRDVAGGSFRPALDSLPPTAIGYRVFAARTQQLENAARELDAAGWRMGPDGTRRRGGTRLDLTLATIAGNAQFERIALLVQASLRRVGIDLAIRTYAYSTIFAAPAGPIYGGTYDLALYSNTLNWDPDVYNFVACDRWYPRGQNIFRYCNPQLDRLERAGLQTDDVSRRAAIYRAAARIIWNDVAYVPLYESDRIVVRSSDLREYLPNPTATPWWNAWRWDI
jgi:peptide/nickel transport system substrate-binding protein